MSLTGAQWLWQSLFHVSDTLITSFMSHEYQGSEVPLWHCGTGFAQHSGAGN